MTTDRPNVVVILADDAGVGDFGRDDASPVPTPNVDAVAADGVRFDTAYAPGAVCTPTRYGLLTGRHHFRTDHAGTGVVFDYTRPILGDEPTIQRVLGRHGYRTYCAGKWHLGIDWTERPVATTGRFRNEAIAFAEPFDGPTAQGFDRFYGIRASLDMPPYCFLENGHVVGHPTEEKETYHAQQRPGPAAPTWDDRAVDRRIVERAVSYLAEAASRDEPFFLYLPTSAPHRPCLPPSVVDGRSDAGDRGDMVALFDRVVGLVDEQLAALGCRDETLLVVASDHGPRPGATEHDPTSGLRGQKATLYEGGIRVPLVVRWPAAVDPATVSTPVSLLDLAPTLGDILGLPALTRAEGRSVAPALRGDRLAADRPVVSEDGGGRLAVRLGRWKYVQPAPHPGGSGGELYDLVADPAETTTRVADEPATAARLRRVLRGYVTGE